MVGIIVGHLAGDYLLQNDWMAQNKTARTLPCVAHVLLYTFAMWSCVALECAALGLKQWPWWAWLIIGGTHFAMDRYRLAVNFMNAVGQRGFREHLGPWSMITVDSSIHIVTAWAVWLLVQGAAL